MRARTTTLLALALLAGCLDLASPGALRRARLNVFPDFGLAGTAAASDVDSFVVIIRNPPAADDTISVRLQPGQDSIVLNIPVDVSAGEDTVAVRFDGYSSVTGLLLYSSAFTNVVLVAGITSASTPVPVTYVGPGQAIASLAVAPATAALLVGGTVQLDYSALDTLGATMNPDSVPVTYITRNGAVVTVSPGGLVTAAGNGDTYVVVRSVARSSIRDSARISVAAVAPALIGLSPTAVAFSDTIGTTNPAPVVVNVTNAGGGTLGGLVLGSITYGAGATGWLTAALGAATAPTTLTVTMNNAGLTPGTYTATVPVMAAGIGNSPQNVTVTLTLAPSAVTSVVITNGFLALRPAETANLTVTGRNTTGGTVPTGPLTYVSRTPGVATVNGSGQVTAVAEGTTIIVASVTAAPTIMDSMLVAVTGNGKVTVAAISNLRAFDQRAAGDTVRIRVAVDLRGVAPEKLGSYNAQLDWDPARLTFVTATTVSGGFAPGGTAINTAGTGSGQLRFGAADAAGHSGPTVALLDITLVAASAGSSPLTLTLTEMSAAQTFTNLLPAAQVVSGRVRVQ